MNLYAYVGSNPANRIDPSGLTAREAAALAAGFGGTASSGSGAGDYVIGNGSDPNMVRTNVAVIGIPVTAGVMICQAVPTCRDGLVKGGAALSNWMFNEKVDNTSPPTTEGVKPPTDHAPFPANPDNTKFPPIKGTGAKVNPEDGSVWERDTSGHGGDQWKRWPDRKSWERGNAPNSVWPDGRVRK